MNRAIQFATTLSAIVCAMPALAQPAAKDNAALKSRHTVDDGKAREGANSFTHAQAKAHIANSGFTRVSPLKKDAQGVWRGTAVKDGRTVQVGLDFKGNVTTAM